MNFTPCCGMQAKQEAADAEAEAIGEGGEVEGFLFGKLLERKPELRSELLTFRDALLASAHQEQKLKVGTGLSSFSTSRPASQQSMQLRVAAQLLLQVQLLLDTSLPPTWISKSSSASATVHMCHIFDSTRTIVQVWDLTDLGGSHGSNGVIEHGQC